MNVIFIDTIINHEDLGQPNKYVLKSSSIQGSSTVYRKYFTKRKTVEYTTDFGVFGENLKTENFFNKIILKLLLI